MSKESEAVAKLQAYEHGNDSGDSIIYITVVNNKPIYSDFNLPTFFVLKLHLYKLRGCEGHFFSDYYYHAPSDMFLTKEEALEAFVQEVKKQLPFVSVVDTDKIPIIEASELQKMANKKT